MSFIKSYDYINLRKKILLLNLLNFMDITFTLLLLETGYFVEANILMKELLNTPILGISLKIGLIFILVILIYINIPYANLRQRIICNKLISFSIIVYLLINMSHIFWTILLINKT